MSRVFSARSLLAWVACLCRGGGGGSVAIVHMGLYTSDIGWGRGLNIVHKAVRRQWFGVA